MAAHPLRRPAVPYRLVGSGLVVLALAGCQEQVDGTRPALAAPPRDARITLDTPADAVQSFFTLLQDHLEAVAADDRVAAARWRDQIAWHVADRDGIATRVSTALGERTPPPAVAIAEYVETWAAMLNYYADLLDRGTIESAADERRAVVRVHLEDGDRHTRLALTCAPDATGQWRVSEVEFVAPARPAPTTAPAVPPTQPAAE